MIFTNTKIRKDTDSFLLPFLFVARRDCQKIVYSNSGTNFRGAESIVRQCLQAWNQDKIIRTLGDKGCKWKFTPPKASHCGGIWERMIRSARWILLFLLSSQLTTDVVILTSMYQVERILNDRPLTMVSNDPNDLGELTPNHLLLLKGAPTSVPVEIKPTGWIRKWKQFHFLVEIFSKRWIKEYLPEPQRRSK